MEKLVITVAADSSLAFPQNHFMPALDDLGAIATQYVDAVSAGASICHLHGPWAVDNGKIVFDAEGWGRLTRLVRERIDDPVIQYGIAGGGLAEKRPLIDLKPDMMSTLYAPYHSRFHYDPSSKPRDVYQSYTTGEIVEIVREMHNAGVIPEAECFHTGAYWSIEYLRGLGLDTRWATLFFDWTGPGAWTPATPEAVAYMAAHLPADVHWSASIKTNRAAWDLIPAIIQAGGHIRVGWEDNPWLPSGELARSNAELVEVVVQLAGRIGREIATPADVRRLMASNRSAGRG